MIAKFLGNRGVIVIPPWPAGLQTFPPREVWEENTVPKEVMYVLLVCSHWAGCRVQKSETSSY
jgi:hypothetical protein